MGFGRSEESCITTEKKNTDDVGKVTFSIKSILIERNFTYVLKTLERPQGYNCDNNIHKLFRQDITVELRFQHDVTRISPTSHHITSHHSVKPVVAAINIKITMQILKNLDLRPTYPPHHPPH
jgi:hypothetical protein